ncbi:MAG: molybdopterin molybdotransferase MoeA [Gammaproteobacteria bacterium]|jgi:molybdopterin molybdotransferase|nr:molybdopterin molybdotransferase MoeA [Gammaproteobacteria bacterium]
MTEFTPEHFRIDIALAEQLIAEHMPTYGAETVPLAAATHRILRSTIRAERDQPPFDRATMDGIAISGADSRRREYRVRGTQAAGQAAATLAEPGDCLEVMTGAVMPVGADTVIPVERVRAAPGQTMVIEEGYLPERGQFVHRRGSDHARDAELLQPGVRIGAPEMAILTAAGQPTVAVAAPPSIAIVSTGDELVDVGDPLTDYQIRSSNDRAIAAALEARSCNRLTRARLPDDPQALLAQIGQLHADHDVLILSGGVSMGKYDYVPAILKQLNVAVVFHKILQRPGLPMWFGVSAAGKPVFALPGNPVSTLVCLIRLVRPALEAAMGRRDTRQPRVPLGEKIEFRPDLTWLLPVKLNWTDAGECLAMPRPTNTSGDFIGLRDTDGVVELPRGADTFAAGTPVKFFSWQ